MTFGEAKEVRLGGGRYRGKTLDQVASTNRGLMYLDWLRSVVEPDPDKYFWVNVEALRAYLDDPDISKEINQLLEEEERPIWNYYD